MANIVTALKALGKKFNTSQTEPSGETVSEVIQSMTTNFNIGASVTAIALTTSGGAVTGGTATLSDGTSVTITVTDAT